MPQDIDLSYAIGLTPEKAVEYFKSKGYTFSWNWYDTWQEAHSIAFTVAKAARLDVLQDIRLELQRALDDGETLAEFRRNLEPMLKAKGWWGEKILGGGELAPETARLGSPWRLELIYRQNMQTAYNAGRWQQQMENEDDRPYLQYVAVMDSRTRRSHAAMNGLVFRADDPVWNTFYPPNGFGCRCSVRALSERNIQERGLTVSSSEGKLSAREVLVSGSTGEIVPVTVLRFRNSTTGEIVEMAPDPGFNYNPGRAAWQPDLSKYPDDLRKAYEDYMRAKGP
jgi:SPP1 gp7 family putative phage head morphogenesis protein